MSNKNLDSEFEFKTNKSSGKGGQHVNKTESRVSLIFNVLDSTLLSESEKQQIISSTLITLSKLGIWQIDVETHRSQLRNKKLAIELFYQKLSKALIKQKKRKKTKPSKLAKEKRLANKRLQSEKKRNRKKDF